MSRDVPARSELQGRLRRVVRQVQARASRRDLPIGGPKITSGDKLQVFFRVESARPPGTAAVWFPPRLTENIRPVRIAYGLGLGSLATDPPDSADSIDVEELESPCFERAREGLESAKREGL